MATLIARLGKDGGYKQVVVEFRSNGKPVDVPGATAYLIRYTEKSKRTTEPAGSDLLEAVGKLRRRQALESGAADLVQSFKEAAKPTSNGHGRMAVNVAIETYLASIEDDYQKQKLAKSSYVSYKKAVEDFGKFCFTEGVQYVDQITGKTLMDHESWLRKTLPKRQGDPIYTFASRFRYLNIFLGQNGIKMAKDKKPKPGDAGLLDHNKVPVAPKRSERDPYEPEEIKEMLKTAQTMVKDWKPKQKDGSDGGFLYKRDAQTALDLIHFALKTGFRDGEIQHAEWNDIDWKRNTISTGPKPKYQWTTKNDKSRPVDIPSLMARLERRQKEQSPKSDLIFPNDVNRPDANLIWFLQEVVKRMESEGRRVKGRIGLHRLRYSMADTMITALNGDVESLKDMLGHHSITITETYLRKNRERQKKAAKTAFKAFGD